jgi:type II secretory pathway pseudopilin PulG
MNRKNKMRHRGFTIVEVMAATVMSSIVIFGIALLLADSQKGWNNTYNHVYSQLVSDSYAAQKSFEGVIRKGSKTHVTRGVNNDWVEIQYYKTDDSTALDGYARFTYSQNENNLSLEHGNLSPRATTSTETICENVDSCLFTQVGSSVHMSLTLDNGNRSLSVMGCAVLSNE